MAGILFRNKPVFLKINIWIILFLQRLKVELTYRPNRLLNGAATRPPKTPPSATTEIAVEYKISW